MKLEMIIQFYYFLISFEGILHIYSRIVENDRNLLIIVWIYFLTKKYFLIRVIEMIIFKRFLFQ